MIEGSNSEEIEEEKEIELEIFFESCKRRGICKYYESDRKSCWW